MHRMHPALAVDTDGHQAVVWHIAATTDDVGMLCGVHAPETTAATQWLEYPEQSCDSCQHAYRQLLAVGPSNGNRPGEGTYRAG